MKGWEQWEQEDSGDPVDGAIRACLRWWRLPMRGKVGYAPIALLSAVALTLFIAMAIIFVVACVAILGPPILLATSWIVFFERFNKARPARTQIDH